MGSVSGERGLRVIFEPGGRIYERTPDGTEHDWDRSDATEVEVTFEAPGEGTAVRIEHYREAALHE